MDANRFDRLARAMTDIRSRRGALAALLGGSLGLLGWAVAQDVDAKNCKKIKDKKKRKKCLAKGKGAASPPPVAPPSPCANGVKDGDETDVDCGGSCPRCAYTKSCATRDDCASALCSGGTCQLCPSPKCDTGCSCNTSDNGSNVCTTGGFTSIVQNCGSCPTGESCVPTGQGNYYCFKRCGTP